MEKVKQHPKRNLEARSLLLLFVGVTMLAMITSSGTLSVEPPNRYIVAKSIVDHHDLKMRFIPDESTPPGADLGIDGNYYSRYGIGQSLIFAGPYYFISRLLGIEADKVIRSIISLTVFPVNLALIAIVFYFLLREFGFNRRRCYLAAVLLVFATGLWQLSKEGQGDAHLALLFVGTAWFLRRYQNNGSLVALAGSAGAMAFAFLIRSDTAPAVLGYHVFALYLINRNFNTHTPSSSPPRRWLPYFLVGGLTLPALLIHMYITQTHFGSPFAGGSNFYSISFLPRGLMGLLLSPGKSIFLYNPIYILSLAGFVTFYRHHRSWAIFIGASFIGCLLLHASGADFHGNLSWGPRYLYRHFPLLFIPVAFFALYKPKLSAIRRAIFALAAVLSILVQIAAVSLHQNRELQEMALAYNVNWSDRQWTMFEPEANFLRTRWTNLRQSLDDMAHNNIAPWPTRPDYLLSAQEQIDAPALHYLAYWPFHLCYYLPSRMPCHAQPLWSSILIFLGGVTFSLFLIVYGWPRPAS